MLGSLRLLDSTPGLDVDQPIKQQLLIPAAIAFGVGAALTSAAWLWVENGPAIMLQLIASSAAFLCL